MSSVEINKTLLVRFQLVFNFAYYEYAELICFESSVNNIILFI